jgi:hypothetical protein
MIVLLYAVFYTSIVACDNDFVRECGFTVRLNYVAGKQNMRDGVGMIFS